MSQSEDEIIVDSITNKKSSTKLDTVSGLLPYKKPKSYKIDSFVDIFDEELMSFDESYGKILSKEGNDMYRVRIFDTDQNPTDEIIESSSKDLRPSSLGGKEVTVMQLARAKISGTDIENKPSPYSFKGECEGGKQYIVPFGGQQARDNLFYPKCEKITGSNKRIYIDHIINGFPSDQNDEENYMIERDGDYDSYSGIFKKELLGLAPLLGLNFLTPKIY